jgi:2'-5' RNA ligase
MLVRAAVVPPPEASEQVAAIVESGATPGSGITPIAAEHLNVLVAQFGNLPVDEVPGLTTALAEAMPDLGAAPTLSLGGGSVADERSYQVVVAEVGGDLERLAEVVRDVAIVAATRRLFVDRRRFRPVLPVATLDPGTAPEAADHVLAALSRFEGSDWTLSGVSLLRGTWVGDEKALGPVYEEFEHFPFTG